AGQNVFLLLLYVVSMYFTVRFGSPPSQDPQQAQTQKIMAFVSPAMIAYFGFQYKWAAALYIYWLAMNVFTVGQQLWMYRKFGIGAPAAVVPDSGTTTKNVTASAGARKALKDGEGQGTVADAKAARTKKRANR
ncbi:MAG: YidC/Oxa1 family membrane protein insertase, partial [Candidatus Eremiobacteraeota bacterium]|nr:YidC/Oxa1 family membrane protein insertase [Candidatus Eremiobacteraeota bacterium]